MGKKHGEQMRLLTLIWIVSNFGQGLNTGVAADEDTATREKKKYHIQDKEVMPDMDTTEKKERWRFRPFVACFLPLELLVFIFHGFLQGLYGAGERGDFGLVSPSSGTDLTQEVLALSQGTDE